MRISCGVRAPAFLAVRERATRRQLNALVRRPELSVLFAEKHTLTLTLNGDE